MKRFFKIAGLTLLLMLVVLFVAGMFTNKDYRIERSVTINKPQEVVFEYTKFLKNQDNFSVWSKIDPGMKKEYRGTDGTVGFVSAWDSQVKEAGAGEQEIKSINGKDRIDYEIRFLKPMKSTDNAYLQFDKINDSATVVTWGFSGTMKYPMNMMLMFMNMETMIGNDLENGLYNLKGILESNK